jgi:predicted DNA-binding WGR domain protein
MAKRMNWVGHYYSRLENSDKLYIVTIEEDEIDGSCSVYAQWGRAGSQLRKQTKAKVPSHQVAEMKAYDIFSAKLAKGYCDISKDPKYSGYLAMDHPSVAPFLVEEEEDLLNDDEFVVVCINNAFIENRFDKDVEYVARKTDDSTVLEVEDRFGEVQRIQANRFQVGTAEHIAV